MIEVHKFYNIKFLEEVLKILINRNSNKEIIKLIKERIELISKCNFKFDILESYKSDELNVSDELLEEGLQNTIITISACIIVYNEERCIERCLNSLLKSKFDEIIIIDTGSSDATKLKVEKYLDLKVKLFDYEWKDDFSDARNFATSKASSDCIFFIDADEYIDDSNDIELKDIVSIFFSNINKEKFVFCPIILDSSNQEIFGVQRIFFKSDKLKYFGTVHEEIRYGSNDILLIDIRYKIMHDGYEKEILLSKKKIQRNVSLLRKMINIEPENPRWIYFLVRDGKDILDDKEMEDYINKYLLIDDKKCICFENIIIHKFTFELLNQLASLYIRQGKVEEVLIISSIMSNILPNNSNSIYYTSLSKILLYKKELKKLLKEVMTYRRNYPGSQQGMINNNGYHIDFIIAILLFENEFYTQSKQYFEFVLNNYKNEFVYNTYKSYFKHK